MNGIDQMEQDWRADSQAERKMRAATQALREVLEDKRAQNRLGCYAEVVQEAQQELEAACAQIVRAWD